MSEIRETETKRKIKFTYIVTAVAISCLMIGGSLGIMIKASPTSAPSTVILPDELQVYKLNGIRYANPLDSSSIQDALTEMTNGGLLIIPAGTYTITSSIIMGSNQAIFGSGIKTKIIVSGATFGIACPTNGHDIIIRNLLVDGTGSLASSQGIVVNPNSRDITIQDCYVTNFQNDAILIAGPNTTSCRIVGCNIYDSGEGPEIYAASGCMITNTVVRGTTDGIELTDGGIAACDNNLISNNIIEDVDTYGIWTYGRARNNTISSNSISLIGQHGISTQSANGTWIAENLLITNNVINRITDRGIIIGTYSKGMKILNNQIISSSYGVDSVAGWTCISGNVIQATTNYAVKLYAASNATISDNTIRNFTATNGVGVYVSGSPKDLTIERNMFGELWGDHPSAINLQATVSRFSISNNVVSDITGTNSFVFNLNSANTGIISNNLMFGYPYSAIYLGTCTQVTIEGNEISYSNRAAIYASSSTNLMISNNILKNNDRGGYTTGAIHLADVQNSTIIGNLGIDTRIPNVEKYGLYSTGTSDYLIVIGNIFTPNLDGNYSLAGTHNLIYGNR